MGELRFEVDLKDKVALVTGATGGLGRVIAMDLADHGATVVALGNENRDGLDSLKEEMYKAGRLSFAGMLVDVSDEAKVKDAVEWVVNGHGKIDILVNCAGLYAEVSTWKMDLDVWDKVIDANLTGTFLTMKHVIPYMKQRAEGRIVNVGSFAADFAFEGTAAYTASKAGLIALTRVVANEVGRIGDITVNVVQPGTFEAGMTDTFDPELKRRLIARSAKRRAGEAQELAWAVLFLCSPFARYVNGEVLHVDGGL